MFQEHRQGYPHSKRIQAESQRQTRPQTSNNSPSGTHNDTPTERDNDPDTQTQGNWNRT